VRGIRFERGDTIVKMEEEFSDLGLSLADAGMAVSAASLASFRVTVLDHFKDYGRDLPWRRTRIPYHILVSEVMLQQTQVARVLDKYETFLGLFPDVSALSAASLAGVLSAWQGLGYNRRALALHQAALEIVNKHGGTIPRSFLELRKLPGIGPATASAICAFAFGIPLPFVETNIRSAFLHFFFPESYAVADSDVLTLVDLTLDRDDPRTWYYALMDYGAWIKKNHLNPSRRSKHHVTQSPFAGSRRELRAQIIRELLGHAADVPGTSIESSAIESSPAREPLTEAQMAARCPGRDPEEIKAVLKKLAQEGFLRPSGEGYRIA
jgi:A/G-specific adenine glycosylase